jgi:hypothetical protein
MFASRHRARSRSSNARSTRPPRRRAPARESNIESHRAAGPPRNQ